MGVWCSVLGGSGQPRAVPAAPGRAGRATGAAGPPLGGREPLKVTALEREPELLPSPAGAARRGAPHRACAPTSVRRQEGTGGD